MSVEAPDKQRQDSTEIKESTSQSELRQRADAVRSRARKFLSTITNTKTSSAKEISELESYLRGMRMKEDGYDGIADREIFFEGKQGEEGWGAKMERSALTLHSRFHSDINRAAQNKWISQASQEKWIRRFEDPSASYKDRERWVIQEMPQMLERWKTAAEERKKLVSNDNFKDLVTKKPELGDILSEEKFLNLHYDKRRSLLGAARASLLADEKGQNGVYDKAKKKLQDAVSAGIMNSGKIGMWLERIFSSNASPAKIEAFVNGSGATSLNALMQNWADVKNRFDAVAKKAKEQGIENAAHGFKVIPVRQFLSMHFAQRLSYVKQAEERMKDANNVVNELPIFLRIRHAMDMKEWSEAAKLIEAAKLMHLKETDWPRLKSMEKHVSQFKGNSQETAKPKNALDHADKITQAKKRLDTLMTSFNQSHSEAYPLVLRLLKGPNANRSINQLRWIWYNNIWCRTHGPPYLNDEIAKKGSSDDNIRLTKHRAEQGLDIGRHDSLAEATADSAYFRKQEVSTHKATFIHAKLPAGGVTSALAEKLEHAQDPRWLYWSSLCPYDSNGDPKPEVWMREGLSILTEARSLIRTVNSGGAMYGGPGHGLISMN